MICDNNPMDIRMMNQSDQIWTETLAKNDVKLYFRLSSIKNKSDYAMISSSMPSNRKALMLKIKEYKKSGNVILLIIVLKHKKES